MRRQVELAIAVLVALTIVPASAIGSDIDDGQAAYNRSDYATALRLWRPLAEQGNARAENNLGVMYENGKGVPPDFAEAVRWYRLAAEQGYAGAQYNLGLIYAIGRGGVQRDPLRAYMWFSIAASGLSGDVGNLVRQTRDVFAGVMTQEQIAAATEMANGCQASGYKDCEPRGETAAAVTPATKNEPAIALTSHEVTPADYPRQSLKLHESGEVTVTYQINESGAVATCTVILSSGNPRFDDAACVMVKKRWKYKPATENGRPVTIQYISKISFPPH